MSSIARGTGGRESDRRLLQVPMLQDVTLMLLMKEVAVKILGAKPYKMFVWEREKLQGDALVISVGNGGWSQQ